MEHNEDPLAVRLAQLERAIRRTRAVATAAVLGLALICLVGAAWLAPQQQDEIRTRLLVIADAQGRTRIVLGAPMPDGRDQVGMKILNPNGAEQFAVGLRPDGSVGMGFDTRPDVGHPGNQERLNMGVTATGRGWIRYLDNQTRARMFLRLDDTDGPVLQFLHWPGDERIVVREVGFFGERVRDWER